MLDLRIELPSYPGLWESVLRPLRLEIIRGNFPPGQRLLEEELAHRFGVSRGPVRGALQRLEQEGLVRSYPRRGVYVVGLSREAIDEIYDMRLLLEAHAARLAATRAVDAQIDYLQHLVDTLADLSRRGRYDMLTDPDIEFHRQLILAAQHSRLLAAWELCAEPARALLSVTTTVRHSLPRAAANHQPIVDAIQSRHAGDAVEAITQHMERARTVMLEVVTGHLAVDVTQPADL